MKQDRKYDVVVVGTGAAGLSAALKARLLGASVLVVEKGAVAGGTTAMSGGCIWAPRHHYQAQMGVTDSREAALEYIREVSPDGWHNTEEPLWSAFVDSVPEMLLFLEQATPLKFTPNREPDPYSEAPGGLTFGRNVSAAPLRIGILGKWRDKVRPASFDIRLNYEEMVDTFFYANPKKWALRYGPRLAWRHLMNMRTKGNALSIGLLKGCLDNDIDIWLKTPAQQLIQKEGATVGLAVERAGEAVSIRADKGVILASGGFEWNPEMMAEHFPGPVEWTASPPTNTGDGQRMAEAVGARLDKMDQALVMGTSPITYEGQLQGLPAADYFLPHSMIVNRYGKRFVNEKQMNVGLAFTEKDPATGEPLHLPAWRIYDHQFSVKYPHAMPKNALSGNRFEADTLEKLAQQIDVDAMGLIETARNFSDFARTGVDKDFGRGSTVWDRNRGGDPDHKPNPTLGTIEQPPFYAMPFKASFLSTKGGARTNEFAEVLDRDDRIIPGLYAAGNVMANSFGSKGVGAGTTLGPCLTWGYIAGLNAASR
ncbi:MAG: FAD-dependent oxidoreductase [Pseudomonadota bacterium]|nr:FAD-dependent oxidoreductase [Pseudomonadota bacterium]